MTESGKARLTELELGDGTPPPVTPTHPGAADVGQDLQKTQGESDEDDTWMPASEIIARRYVSSKGTLTKLAKRHPGIRREATPSDRKRWPNEQFLHIYNVRRVYELTEGKARE